MQEDGVDRVSAHAIAQAQDTPSIATGERGRRATHGCGSDRGRCARGRSHNCLVRLKRDGAQRPALFGIALTCMIMTFSIGMTLGDRNAPISLAWIEEAAAPDPCVRLGYNGPDISKRKTGTGLSFTEVENKLPADTVRTQIQSNASTPRTSTPVGVR